MPIPVYLAMTEAEMVNCNALPQRIAWMSCLFSPYGTGLVGIPQNLPPQSMLILSDRIPIRGHDPDLIAEQLQDAMERFHCESLLLDLQKPNDPQTQALVRKLACLDCTICVSECYCDDWDGPVLLPPVPLNQTPQAYLKGWNGRELWLEAELSGLRITVSSDGSHYHPIPPVSNERYPFFSKTLLCHYRHEVKETAEFYLKRTQEDLSVLLSSVEHLGVTRAIGFFRELATNVDNDFVE